MFDASLSVVQRKRVLCCILVLLVDEFKDGPLVHVTTENWQVVSIFTNFSWREASKCFGFTENGNEKLLHFAF